MSEKLYPVRFSLAGDIITMSLPKWSIEVVYSWLWFDKQEIFCTITDYERGRTITLGRYTLNSIIVTGLRIYKADPDNSCNKDIVIKEIDKS